MKRTLLPLNALRVFDAAARHLSFTRAADELAVTPAAVGQQIRALEDALGVVLYELLAGARPYRVDRDSRGALLPVPCGPPVPAAQRARLGAARRARSAARHLPSHLPRQPVRRRAHATLKAVRISSHFCRASLTQARSDSAHSVAAGFGNMPV